MRPETNKKRCHKGGVLVQDTEKAGIRFFHRYDCPSHQLYAGFGWGNGDGALIVRVLGSGDEPFVFQGS